MLSYFALNLYTMKQLYVYKDTVLEFINAAQSEPHSSPFASYKLSQIRHVLAKQVYWVSNFVYTGALMKTLYLYLMLASSLLSLLGVFKFYSRQKNWW